MPTKKILLCVCLIAVSGIFFGISYNLARKNLQFISANNTRISLSAFVFATSTPAETASTSSPAQSTTQQKKSPVILKPSTQTIVQTSQTLQAPQTASTSAQPVPNFTVINTTARTAVVNIICTTQTNGMLNPITATGVVIDPRGIILTNAHVGQYWLLQNFQEPNFVTCEIRTGSPAQASYHAELLYISPTWVQNNASILTETNPQGTGESDFALLHITDTVNGSALPTSFPYLPPGTDENITLGEPVNLVSYPAGFLDGQSILQDLYMASALTTVQNIFTFGTSTTDLLSVGGTVISQKGASGGAVVDGNGTLIGIISTETDATTTAGRDLRAITLAHINRTLQSEIDYTLAQFLSYDPATTAHSFQTNIAPTLSKMIEAQLLK